MKTIGIDLSEFVKDIRTITDDYRKKYLEPTGAEIHQKYLELGGHGIFYGNEPQYVKDNESRVLAILTLWKKAFRRKNIDTDPKRKAIKEILKNHYNVVSTGATNDLYRLGSLIDWDELRKDFNKSLTETRDGLRYPIFITDSSDYVFQWFKNKLS